MKSVTKRMLLAFCMMAMLIFAVVPVQVMAEETAAEFQSTEDANQVIEEQQAIIDAATEKMEEANSYVTEKEVKLYATFWALVPPLVAIALALITKEVYISLFIGILTGGLFYANFSIEGMVTTVFQQGIVAKLSDSYNVGILIFLVILGVMVSLMNKVGGSAAYGRWACTKIKTRRGAMLATFGLGVLIFIDDYFNCLTVGSVMRPVTDKFKISRAKLAYIIDATAAPVCIIAPISSWAAAVSGIVEGTSGLKLFIQSIPYNFYALLTIVTVLVMSVSEFEFGPMRLHEHNAKSGDLFTTGDRPFDDSTNTKVNEKGKVIDLILPVIVLVLSCVAGMLYTGGFFSGTGFVTAFAECSADQGLTYGSFIALVVTFFIYIPRKVITFKEFAASLADGFKAMVPAILILTFAWTLSGITRLLGADVYVAGIVEHSAGSLQLFLPCIIFAISLGLAFATGTSWGTFGILLPIVVAVLTPGSELLIISISACLAGAVCGDHISPISDTTIMASTGAQCNHINHVSTQLPYALTVAAVSFVSYIFAAFIQNVWISLPLAIVLMLGVLYVLSIAYKNKPE